MKKFCAVLTLILLVISLIPCKTQAAATTGYGIDSSIEYVQNFTSGRSSSGRTSMINTLLKHARNLFILLASISLALGLIRMLLSGESNVGTLAALIARWILYVGVFSWLMSSNAPQIIVNSFVRMGSQIGGTGSIAPDNILAAGIRMYGTLVQRGWEAGWGDFIGVTLLGLIILVVIAIIAGTFALALIEMHLVICGGAVLLGFSGFDFTRDIALSYLKYSISVGIKLMMIMIIYGLANSLIPSWESSFKSANNMSALITSAGQILGGTICILMTARYVPNAAQAVVNRASMTLGSPVYVMNNTRYSGMMPSSISSSGGLVRTFIDALRGNKIASTSTNSTITSSSSQDSDANNTVRAVRNGSNEGMITSSGYVPLGSRQTSRHVMNPANAQSMENYVSASNLRSEFAPSSSSSASSFGQSQAASITGFNMSASRQPVSRPAGRTAISANQIVQNIRNQRMLDQLTQSQSRSRR